MSSGEETDMMKIKLRKDLLAGLDTQENKKWPFFSDIYSSHFGYRLFHEICSSLVVVSH